MRRSLDLLILAGCLCLYLGLAAAQIERPGLYYDEAADAVPAVQIVTGRPIEALRNASLPVLDRRIPLMIFDYVGPWNTYLLVPIFQVFGISVASLRGLTVGAGALTVVLAYAFAVGLAGRVVAAGVVLLLAVSPAFVLWTREGIHVTSTMLVFSLGSLVCLQAWRRTGRAGPLILAGLLLGLGLAAKLLFFWWITGLAVTAALLIWLPDRVRRSRGLPPERPRPGATLPVLQETYALPAPYTYRNGGPHGALAVLAPPRPPAVADPPAAVTRRPSSRRSTPVWAWPVAAVALLVGAWPLIVYNLMTQGTIDVLLRNSVSTDLGVNNLDLPANLAKVAEHARAAIQGGVFWYLGGTFENQLWPPALALAAAGWAVLLIGRPEARRRWRGPAFLFLMSAALLFQSAFTVSSLEPTHHLIVWPLPQILVVWCLAELVRWVPRPRRRGILSTARPVAAGVGFAALLVLWSQDLATDLRYHEVLARTGGLGDHSDAIYTLSDWLARQPAGQQPIALDWGIRQSVIVLTQGRVEPTEIFMYDREPPPLFFDWLYGALTKQPDQIYLLHADRFAVFPRRTAFEDLAGRLGRQVKVEADFRQREGTPVYLAYSAKPG